VKYMIKAKIEVDGVVEKPDIIGAIFGQTEGLFGPDFDLRELQEKGRIGRILVEIRRHGNRIVGEITIPSNLDRYETALLAAMIEQVDKVGPHNARIHVSSIIDVRQEKIRKIIERAKDILTQWLRERPIDMKEVLNELIQVTRMAEVIYYGPERLPAGPDVDRSDTVIIVEGRADVVNLLRYGYRNVIALGGATGKVPETIIKLASRKKAIAFMDGDRAGDMILKELLRVADIDYVAKAPPGKEVEELTGKEIVKALKNLIPAKQYLQSLLEREKLPEKLVPKEGKVEEVILPIKAEEAVKVPEVPKPIEFGFSIPLKVVEETKALQGTLEGNLYDKDWNLVKHVAVRDLYDTLSNLEPGKVFAVVADTIVTQRLVDISTEKGVKLIVGARIGNLTKKSPELVILTFSDILH